MVAAMTDPRKHLTRVLAGTACASSLLPYFLSRIPVDYAVKFNPFLLFFLGPLVWLMLVLATLLVGKWNRKIWWLFILFPVAFGPILFILLMVVVSFLTGLAP
jgi:hypothetical protein